MPDTTVFTRAIPVLPALDIAENAAFYTRVLGFTLRHQEGEFAILHRDGVELHFWKCADRGIAESSGCRIQVAGIDALYTRCREAGVIHPKAPLAEKPWGTREFGMIDGNGNLLTFFEPR